ncbi:MAG: hypothetical protein Q9227_006672 [Pyrenula ochraceoflavens]
MASISFFIQVVLFALGLFSRMSKVTSHPHNSANLARYSSGLTKRSVPFIDGSFDAQEREIMNHAFNDALDMIKFLDLDKPDIFNKNFQKIFYHYFNVGDWIFVKKTFQVMLDAWPGPGPNDPPNSVFKMHLDHEYCHTSKPDAFWIQAPKPGDNLYICPRIWRLPNQGFWSCDQVQTWKWPNYWMISTATVMIHELMHFDPVTQEPNDGVQIIDHGDEGYGPWQVTQYKKKPGVNARDNADNWTWFVIELYYSKKCDVAFGEAELAADTEVPPMPDAPYQVGPKNIDNN